tara:strand:+ start:588 stop:1166 length:579 start_codon:yes stop_codon:yes gene_type:complete
VSFKISGGKVQSGTCSSSAFHPYYISSPFLSHTKKIHEPGRKERKSPSGCHNFFSVLLATTTMSSPAYRALAEALLQNPPYTGDLIVEILSYTDYIRAQTVHVHTGQWRVKFNFGGGKSYSKLTSVSAYDPNQEVSLHSSQANFEIKVNDTLLFNTKKASFWDEYKLTKVELETKMHTAQTNGQTLTIQVTE